MESTGDGVDFLKFQRKVNTLLGMPFYVYSTNKFGEDVGSTMTVLYQYFTEIIAMIVTFGQFWAVPHVYQDMNVLCGCLSSGAHSTQVVAKTILLRMYKSQYLAQIKAAHSLQKDTDKFEREFFKRESDFPNYCHRQTRYIHINVTLQLATFVCSTSIYFIPFLYDSLVNSAELERQRSPIVIYLPVDYNYTPLYQIIMLTLTVGFYVINLKTVVLDNFILNLIVLHMSELKYHNELLKEMTESDGGVSQTLMKAWIRQHQALIRLCDDFRKLISPFLFIEFSYILIHTCMPAFVITSTFSWNLPQKMAVICLFGGGLIELFLMSSAGGVFSETWRSTGNDVYQPQYFFKDEKWMRQVSGIIQQKVQKPFRLSAFKLIPLNRGTYASILRLIFSYYMTLNQIQQMKRND